MTKQPPSDGSLHLLKNAFIAFHLLEFGVVNRIAPEPYIDEIFHVPQVQAYCNGHFSSWNNKITTPPGL
jgi:alpha-1,2-glucosyltransferase